MSPSIVSPLVLPTVARGTAQSMTLEEFIRTHEGEYRELIKGIVKELPMPTAKHGVICVKIAATISHFVDLHQLGWVASNDSFVKISDNPPTVRGADVSFYSYARVPKGAFPEGLLDVAPDLVAEVRSPSESWSELITKVLEYLAAGVRAVVVFSPTRQAIAVYRSNAEEEHFSLDQDLTISDVLPGFSVPVRRFFE